jgi:2-polyprenyl-3-methyl-5-hydroxy-6-metoxy-1,4-benzoquinol methylase
MKNMKIETVTDCINQMHEMLNYLKKLAESEKALTPPPTTEKERIKELSNLRMLLNSNVWPEAVDEEYVTQNQKEEKVHRGAAILRTLVNTDLIEANILDFGTGDGYVAYVAANLFSPRQVIGYDITEGDWEALKDNHLIFTTKWEEVVAKGPYDIIILNDILDHAGNVDFTKIREVKSEAGRVFVRCHPWCSRHGAHAHESLNKAFVHLIFTEDEMYSMGIKTVPTQMLLDPLKAYKKLFQDAGLSVVRETVSRRDVEFFFIQNAPILRRIKEKWAKSEYAPYASGEEFPRELLEIEAVDFTLM